MSSEGHEELVEYRLGTFVFLVGLLGLGGCECEKEAVGMEENECESNRRCAVVAESNGACMCSG